MSESQTLLYKGSSTSSDSHPSAPPSYNDIVLQIRLNEIVDPTAGCFGCKPLGMLRWDTEFPMELRGKITPTLWDTFLDTLVKPTSKYSKARSGRVHASVFFLLLIAFMWFLFFITTPDYSGDSVPWPTWTTIGLGIAFLSVSTSGSATYGRFVVKIEKAIRFANSNTFLERGIQLKPMHQPQPGCLMSIEIQVFNPSP